MKVKTKTFVFWFFSILIFLNIFAVILVFDLRKERFLEINFFQVGQGDAIFIETPQKHQILIDGGPSSVILEKLTKEMPFWDRTIDLVILTHPEKDHLFGLLETLKRYRVENILWTGIKRKTNEFKEWEKEILKEKGKIVIAKSNQKIIAGKAIFKILYPFENLNGQEFDKSNETSIVNQLIFGKNSFLFSGDIGNISERKILEKYSCFKNDYCPVLDSDILKVAHHGSKNSTSKEFLEKVSPKIAVISVGKGNSYGHPHQEVLEIFKSYGIKIMRTDLDGDIKIISDGENIKVKNPEN